MKILIGILIVLLILCLVRTFNLQAQMDVLYYNQNQMMKAINILGAEGLQFEVDVKGQGVRTN